MRGGPGWKVSSEIYPSLPALAWMATVRPGQIEVQCGSSVRIEPDGVFEGTWAGDSGLCSLVGATTVFGSGLVLDDGGLMAVPPSHGLEAIYAAWLDDTAYLSNSLVGLLELAGLKLDADIGYPDHFRALAELKWPQISPVGTISGCMLTIPTTTIPVRALYAENARVGRDGFEVIAKPRERTFGSYDEYRQRLFAAMASLIENSRGREPVVALSSGYDSTAVAAVASHFGCRRALSFEEAKPSARGQRMPDSGDSAAAALGLTLELFDRLGYQARDDLPEAEFLATGMTAEDVIMAAFEPQIRGAILLTGYWSGTAWHPAGFALGPFLAPPDLAACSMTEFRLRADVVHAPLPYFGGIQWPTMSTLAALPEMKPFSVRGGYDRPVPRRLAEEAGVVRGTFALSKRAANATLHSDGESAFAPPTLDAIRRFAAAEGRRIELKRRRFGRPRRGAITLARRVRVLRLVGPLVEQRRRLVHFEPAAGALLFRWAVSVIRPRYQIVSLTVETHEQH